VILKAAIKRFLFSRGTDKAEEIVSKSVRHGAGLVAGWLVAKGYADEQSAAELTGAVLAVGTVAWSIARTFIGARL
jgi:hypothetical protein